MVWNYYLFALYSTDRPWPWTWPCCHWVQQARTFNGERPSRSILLYIITTECVLNTNINGFIIMSPLEGHLCAIFHELLMAIADDVIVHDGCLVRQWRHQWVLPECRHVVIKRLNHGHHFRVCVRAGGGLSAIHWRTIMLPYVQKLACVLPWIYPFCNNITVI